MSLLRRLASAGGRNLETLERELVDRFGKISPAAGQLVELFRLRALVRQAGLSSMLVDGFGGVVLTIGDERAWERANPFNEGELTWISIERRRHALPERAGTPGERLRYLLERFTPAKKAAKPPRRAAPAPRT